MNAEFNKMRTDLANNFASAGAALLDYMTIDGTKTAALAAIPESDPQQYAIAGTLAGIAQMLPKAAPGVEAMVERSSNELHNAIMNLPAKHAEDFYATTALAYKVGHRDARHAAAELSLAATTQASTAQAEPTLDAVLSCYSPDDSVGDYQDKIRALYEALLAPAPKFKQIPGALKKAVSKMTRAELQVEVFELRNALSNYTCIAAPAGMDEREAFIWSLGRAAGAEVATSSTDAQAAAEVRDAWISVDERLPEDDQAVAFVVDSNGWERFDYLTGRVLGGAYNKSVGGFSVPGLTIGASHWMPLPAAPVVLRSAGDTGEPA